ncbi:hypothetical protein AALO_G00090880 [Alosa alosa]|uniref:Uncharacterized protein n=1 Tax=Alosa alosa TaxID=278164 RepID=A0AAV6GV87_9TELE|nr:hypothetical protein AALO_G00090880 [Alosa alosa]
MSLSQDRLQWTEIPRFCHRYLVKIKQGPRFCQRYLIKKRPVLRSLRTPTLFPYCSRTAQTQPNSAETLLKLSQTADSLNMCHDSANPLSNTLTSNATNDCLIESVDFPERSVLMGSFHQGDLQMCATSSVVPSV